MSRMQGHDVLTVQVLNDETEFEDASGGQELEEALATAEEPEADENEHRAAVLAKMSQLPEAKEKIEIISRAQYGTHPTPASCLNADTPDRQASQPCRQLSYRVKTWRHSMCSPAHSQPPEYLDLLDFVQGAVLRQLRAARQIRGRCLWRGQAGTQKEGMALVKIP